MVEFNSGKGLVGFHVLLVFAVIEDRKSLDWCSNGIDPGVFFAKKGT